MGGYKNGKVEIFYGDSPPSNLNILWQKRIVINNVESSELMQYNSNLNVWQSLANTSKAPIASPAFTGTATLNGEAIATTPQNGVNYLMVYGVGNPTENASELQAAYDEAKTMPRYLGSLIEGNSIYKDQTFELAGQYYVYDATTAIIPEDFADILADSTVISTEAEAKSVRATIIVAPGNYTGASAFIHTESGIVITTLTGNADVIIYGGIAYDFSKDATRQYADNTAATAAGLSVGEYYNTDGVVKIVT